MRYTLQCSCCHFHTPSTNNKQQKSYYGNFYKPCLSLRGSDTTMRDHRCTIYIASVAQARMKSKIQHHQDELSPIRGENMAFNASVETRLSRQQVVVFVKNHLTCLLYCLNRVIVSRLLLISHCLLYRYVSALLLV